MARKFRKHGPGAKNNMSGIKWVVGTLYSAATRFEQNDGWVHSSHVALSLLLALFPFCIFSLSLAVEFSTGLEERDLITFVLGAWPEAISEPIVREIEAVLSSRGSGSLTLSAFLALFFASNGVDAFRTAITDAYRETDPRPFWKTRLLCVVFVIIGAAFLSIAGAMTVALPLYFQYFQDAAPALYNSIFASERIRTLITMMLALSLLIACHRYLPGVKRPLWTVLPGVALTLVLWWVAAKVFAYYIGGFASYSVTYAGLAGIMAALVFLYMMAAIFIYGAEVNGQLDRERRARNPAPGGEGGA